MPNPTTTIHRSALMSILHDLKDGDNGQKLQLGGRMNPLSGHLLRLIGRRHYLAVWHDINAYCQQRQDEEERIWWKHAYKQLNEFCMMTFSKLAATWNSCRKRNRVSSEIDSKTDPNRLSATRNRRFRDAARLLISNHELREQVKAMPMEVRHRTLSNVAQLDLIEWQQVVAKRMKSRESESLTFAELFLILMKWAIPFDHLTIVEQLERKEDILIGTQSAAVSLFAASFRGHAFRKQKRMTLQKAKGTMLRAARTLLANQNAVRLNARMSSHMNKSADNFEEIEVERRISNKVAAPEELQEQTVRFERMASRMKLDMQSSSKKCAQVSNESLFFNASLSDATFAADWCRLQQCNV